MSHNPNMENTGIGAKKVRGGRGYVASARKYVHVNKFAMNIDQLL